MFANSRLNFAAISDIHLNLAYDPNIAYSHGTPRSYCQIEPGAFLADEVANFGRYGCDTPPLMFDNMLKIMQNELPNLDVLFVPGDLIGHSYPEHEDDPTAGNYEALLEIHKIVGQKLADAFPDTIILPTIGNNDTKYHYQAPE